MPFSLGAVPYPRPMTMARPDIGILLVEDNPGDARLIRELLKETEYAHAVLIHVATLEEALDVRPEMGAAFCVLLDLNLPDGQGMVTLRRVREFFVDSAIVVLTGLSDEQVAIQALQEGAQNYLYKDELDARLLGRTLRHSIERHDFVVRLREADRAMVLRERRFRALVERSNDLTLLMDEQGRITYMSPIAARSLLGTEVDAERMSVTVLVHEEDAGTVDGSLRRSVAEPGVPVPITLRARQRRADRTIWLEGTLTNLLDVPGVNAVVANLHDITARHAAEHELHVANQDLERRVEERTSELRKVEEELREALEAERKVNELKTRFVSMASHEFRTPLTTILSSADLIGEYNAKGDGNDKIRAHAERIRGKVQDLTGILTEFLSVEKLEKGLDSCVPEDLDLVRSCDAVIEEMQAIARNGQRIRSHGTDPSIMVRLDRRMLANVLRNLLSNAIKYSPEGSEIVLRPFLSDGRVRIEVADRGIGIPVEEQEHLFDRFFRASNAGTVQGTGLGLHIVRRYAELMNGGVTFRSVPGEGSTFTVDLPVRL